MTGAVLAIAVKDLRLLLRDRAGLFFTIGFPLLFAIFFGSVMSGQGGGRGRLSIVVADEDGSAGSRAFVDRLRAAAELEVDTADRRAAEDLVRRGKRTACVALLPGFGAAQERLFWGEPARMEVGIDPSRSAEAGMLEGVLTRHGFERMQRMFEDPRQMTDMVDRSLAALEGAPDAPATRFLGELRSFLATRDEAAAPGAGGAGSQGWTPLAIDVKAIVPDRAGPPSAFAVSFPQGLVWGVMGCAAAFGVSLVTERRSGTLTRLRTAPISQAHVLAGKALACFVATMGVQALLLGAATLVFGVSIGSPPLLAAATLAISACFVGIMMLLSVLGSTEQAASGIGWSVLLVMAMIGGGMIPHFVMPAWMRTMGNASPVRWAILSLEGAIWRGMTAAELALPMGVLVAVGGIAFAAGAAVFSRRAAA